MAEIVSELLQSLDEEGTQHELHPDQRDGSAEMSGESDKDYPTSHPKDQELPTRPSGRDALPPEPISDEFCQRLGRQPMGIVVAPEGEPLGEGLAARPL